jgi:prepilin-type N-terminal cleavage/methylation domain-containing protein
MEPKFSLNRRQGFTLVELLVVITIVAVLALLSFAGATMFIDRGRKVQAVSQFRDLSVGLQAYMTENQRPPLPQANRDSGEDAVFGVVGDELNNDFIVAALYGDVSTLQGFDNKYTQEELNPKKESYLVLPMTPAKKNGMGPDAVLYDPWGRPIMIAINAPPFQEDSAGGTKDRLLSTKGIGEYTDTKPREQDYVFWAFGKDGKKGKGGASNTAVVPYGNSDDVVSWQ